MKKGKYFIVFLAIVIIFIVGTILCAEYYSNKYSENVFRLHILANSNTVEDQALKLKVRDCIGETVDLLSKEAQNAYDMERLIEENADKIRSEAQKCIEREGFDYDVKIEIGNFYFPTKSYGSEALPAGEYNAVRIIIGEGKGDNWWCIMFPPLCLSNGNINSVAKNNQEEDVVDKITVKFKFVEIFQEMRNRFKCLFNF